MEHLPAILNLLIAIYLYWWSRQLTKQRKEFKEEVTRIADLIQKDLKEVQEAQRRGRDQQVDIVQRAIEHEYERFHEYEINIIRRVVQEEWHRRTITGQMPYMWVPEPVLGGLGVPEEVLRGVKLKTESPSGAASSPSEDSTTLYEHLKGKE